MAKKLLIAGKLDAKIVGKLTEDHGVENIIFANGYPDEPTKETLEAAILLHKPDVIFVRSAEITAAAANGSNSYMITIRGGAGTDKLTSLKNAGREVQNTPGANAWGVVDLATGFLGKALFAAEIDKPRDELSPTLQIFYDIISNRQINESFAAFNGQGNYKNDDKPETLNEKALEIFRQNQLLKGKKILITGATGETGKKMVEVAQALGMEVLAVEGRKITAEYAGKHGITLVKSLNEALPEADIVSLHTELNEQTKDSFGQHQFDLLKQGAIVINCARAGLFKEGAATNNVVMVDDDPIAVKQVCNNMGRLSATAAKSGAKTKESTARVGEMALEQIQRALYNQHSMPERVVSPAKPQDNARDSRSELVSTAGQSRPL